MLSGQLDYRGSWKRYFLSGVLFSALALVLTACPAPLGQPPIALITAIPTSGEAPLLVNFDGTQSSDPDGTIVSFQWDFDGNGTIDATGATQSHSYEASGLFKAVLIVTDNSGLIDKATVVINTRRASIYFASNRVTPGFFELFKMDTDGTNQAQVTNVPSAHDVFPALLPNTRDKLAFASDRDSLGFFNIFKANPDGSLPTNLTVQTASHSIQPSWAPDGTKLVFASDRTGNWEIFLMNSDGTNVTQLTFQTPHIDVAPAISPDGTEIVFASNRDGDFEIYKMRMDGTGVVQLTANTAGDGAQGPALLGLGFGLDTITWAPNGAKIAFTSDRDGDPEIFIMNADGSGVTQFTTNTLDDFDPFWLPNGIEIAFVRDLDAGPGFDLQIFKKNVLTGTETQLTNLGTQNVTPADK